MIIWIASYPKSGNTWVRSFLSSYFLEDNEEFTLSSLTKINQFPLLKHYTDINENPKNLLESAMNWITVQNKINLSNDVQFLKTHHAMCTIQNYPFTNKDNTMGAIYLVRDPRDIVISYSNHDNTNYKTTVEAMIKGKIQSSFVDDKEERSLAVIGSWSQNYNSWKNFELAPRLIIKYEDLVLNAAESFNKIIIFLNSLYGLNINEDKIKKSIETTKFEKLKNLEKSFGFKENENEKELFFREGKVGQWKKLLAEDMVNKIEKAFSVEMKELGYIS